MNPPKFKKGEMVIVNFSSVNNISLYEPKLIEKVIYRKKSCFYKLEKSDIFIHERNIVSVKEAMKIVLNYINKF